MSSDPLPSWNECAARSAIVDFVARATREGGPDFIRPAERIATFDNDGTLWCEFPAQTQVFFAQWRLRSMAERDPSLRERQPYKAFLESDMQTLRDMGKKAVFEIALTTHAGMTEDDFDALACEFFATEQHPRFKRPFNKLVYRPQLELLTYLRQHEFKVFIVSGGGVDLIRTFAEDAYGIARERVIGSSVKTRLDGPAHLMKLADLNTFDDREVKVQNIGLQIGRRPAIAFGNSDGDLAMMRYALAGSGARLAFLLRHDDAEREFAYDSEFKLSPLVEGLAKAKDYGITLVSMKHDWSAVF